MGWWSGSYPSVSRPSTLCCVILGLGQHTKFLLSGGFLCAIRWRHRLTAGRRRDFVPSRHFLWAFSSQESHLQTPCFSPGQNLTFPPQSLNLLCSFQHSQPHRLLGFQRQRLLFLALWALSLWTPAFPVSLFLMNSDFFSLLSRPRAGGCSLDCYFCNSLVFLGLFSYPAGNFRANSLYLINSLFK